MKRYATEIVTDTIQLLGKQQDNEAAQPATPAAAPTAENAPTQKKTACHSEKKREGQKRNPEAGRLGITLFYRLQALYKNTVTAISHS